VGSITGSKWPETKHSSETQSILDLRNNGYSRREIAKKLKIPYNAVYYSLHRTAQTGSNQNRKNGRYNLKSITSFFYEFPVVLTAP
jgi:transposase